MKRKGFTVWEVIVVIAIIVFLAAILFPVLVPHRPEGGRGACRSDLKQIALGFKQYIQDYDEKYPVAKNSNSGLDKPDNWAGELQPYVKSTQIFVCPSDTAAKGNKTSSYGYNARLSKFDESKMNDSAFTILNFEVIANAQNWTQTGSDPGAVSASTRHLDGANYSFADGHVKWLKPGKVGIASPQKGEPTFVPK